MYELGIISQSVYHNFTAYLRQNLFLKRENFMGNTIFFETPAAYDLKFLRAQSEGLLSPDMNRYYKI